MDKDSSNPYPMVTIITVTYNAEKYLEKTIQSILAQSYPYIEYLIVDGKSSDGTLAIIQHYASSISAWISEEDQGIYDAMNKALAMAQGDYVWFMNAGDEIYAPDTLEKMMQNAGSADIYYGETLYITPAGEAIGLRSEVTPLKLPAQLTWRDLRYGLMVCHQSIIVGRELAVPYDLQHPYSADIDWVIRCLKQAGWVVNTGMVLARYRQGGFSRQHLGRSLSDRFKILQKHYGFFSNLLNHSYIVSRSLRYLLIKRRKY
ncbi:MAG: glycosyltransferase [Bacteroidia bacterium]|nr:glycosyltransferase [Bacteroidia bacterium]